MQPNSLSPALVAHSECLGLPEKETARILRPQTFSEIPRGLDSLKTFDENYFCVLMHQSFETPSTPHTGLSGAFTF